MEILNSMVSSVTSFFSKKYLKLVKNRLFLVKKLEIQVIVLMNMLTRSSETIFNPMRYSGYYFGTFEYFLQRNES